VGARAGDVKTASWPYSPTQCPNCHYLQPFDPRIPADDGYDVLGFCRHPRIGMELFEPRLRAADAWQPCPCFLPASFRSPPPERP
jgi:hypothetical protein